MARQDFRHESAVLHEDLSSRMLGPYRLRRRLGAGGMGAVYLAEDSRDGNRYAIKTLNASTASQTDQKRFIRETQAIGRLNHPNIIPLRDAGQHDGIYWYCMEYIEGQPLSAWIDSQRPALKDLVRLLLPICDALHFAHERLIIHRDIKPENILIDHAGAPHLMDFGVARDLAQGQKITRKSEALGTPEYMAPEQVRNERDRYGPATDVWAMGVVLYEAVTGSVPFEGHNYYETFRRVVDADPPRMSRLTPGVPAALDAIVLRCLQKDPRRRYESARGLGDDLARWVRGERVLARAPGPVRWLRRSYERHAPLLWAGLTAAAVICTVALWAWNEQRKSYGPWLTHCDWRAGEVDSGAPLVLFTGELATVDQWQSDGQPIVLASQGHPGAWLGCLAPGIGETVAVTAEVEVSGEPDALEICYLVDRLPLQEPWHMPPGPFVRLGSPHGGRIVSGVQSLPGPRQSGRSVSGYLPVGRRARLRVERDGMTTTLSCDGEELLRVEELLPRAAGDAILLRTFRPGTRIHALRVESRAQGTYASPLIAADALFKEGLYRRAFDRYRAIAQAHPHEEVGLIALARAAALAVTESAPAADALIEELERRPRSGRYRQLVGEVMVRTSWRRGAYDTAITYLQGLTPPTRRSAMAAELAAGIAENRHSPDAEVCDALLNAQIDDPARRDLELGGFVVSSFETLRRRRWQSIRLDHVDLSVPGLLRGIEAERLDLAQTNLGSLADVSLAGLRRLVIDGCRIDDLGPLAAARQLRYLSAAGNRIVDARPLAGLPLEYCNLQGNPIESLPDDASVAGWLLPVERPSDAGQAVP